MERAFETAFSFPERIKLSGLCYSILEANLRKTVRLEQVRQTMFEWKFRRRTSTCALQALNHR